MTPCAECSFLLNTLLKLYFRAELSKRYFSLFHHWLHNILTLRLSSCRWKSVPNTHIFHSTWFLIMCFLLTPNFFQTTMSVTAGAGSESPLSLWGCCLRQLPAVKRLFVGVISKSMRVVCSVMFFWVCVRWLPRPMSQDQTVNKAVSRKQSRFCCVTLPPSLPPFSLFLYPRLPSIHCFLSCSPLSLFLHCCLGSCFSVILHSLYFPLELLVCATCVATVAFLFHTCSFLYLPVKSYTSTSHQMFWSASLFTCHQIRFLTLCLSCNRVSRSVKPTHGWWISNIDTRRMTETEIWQVQDVPALSAVRACQKRQRSDVNEINLNVNRCCKCKKYFICLHPLIHI